MVHSGILPHHPRWAKLFENLRYVIIDELHAYRGVFGSHLCNVLRRLRRICRHYGSNPVFLCSSATIQNPRELAERPHRAAVRAGGQERRAARREVLRVREPAGRQSSARHPPLVSRRNAPRRVGVPQAQPAAHRLRAEPPLHRDPDDLSEGRFRGDSRRAGEDSRLSRRLPAAAAARDRKGPARRRGARGGVDQRARARHRHRRARRLGDGRLSGHDRRHLAARRPRGPAQRPIGGGHGGQQRAARSVRRAQPVVFLRRVARARADRSRQPAHPGRSHQVRGVRAAVHVRPKRSAAPTCRRSSASWPSRGWSTARTRTRRGPGPTSRIRPTPSACGRCRRTTSSSSTSPARRASSARPISRAARPRCTRRRSTSSKGTLFQVERLDFEGRKAFVRSIDCDYYTTAISYAKVTPIDTFAAAPERSHGEVHVVSRVVGFKKIKFYTNENVGSGELDLPEQQMHTTSYWLTIPSSVMGLLPYASDDRRDGVVGLAFALKQVAQLLLMCDGHDIGISINSEETDGAGERRRDQPADDLRLRQLSGRHRLQRAAVRHAPRAPRGDAAADRRVPVRERLPRLRRARSATPVRWRRSRRSGFSICWRGCDTCRAGPFGPAVRRRRGGRAVLSSLADRIRGIVAPGTPGHQDRPASPPCRAAFGPPAGRRHRRAALGGVWRGGCFVVDRRWEPSALHGRERIGALAERLERAAGEAPLFTGGAPARPPFVFFDLETTGLSGGAGHAGVPGRLRLVRGRRLVRHAPVPARPARGRADAARGGGRRARARRRARQLQRQVVRRAAARGALSVPPARVARTRAAARRRAASRAAVLERAARGRRRARLPVRGLRVQGPSADEGGCSLQSRSNASSSARGAAATCRDSRFPARYFQFVRSGDAGPLEAVLEHNRLDLLTLAALTARLLHLTRSGPDAARDAREALALGHVYARGGSSERAREPLPPRDRPLPLAARRLRSDPDRRAARAGARVPPRGVPPRRGGRLLD